MFTRTGEPLGIIQGGGASASGVSWGAILAGAVAAAALSFILIILGFGLGLSAVSPWSGSGASMQAIGVSTIVWIAFTQIAASAIGGFMAGRLRVKWAGIHNDEVYFRDTAHGFLAWAVASLVTAALLTGAIGGVLSGGAKAVDAGVAAAPQGNTSAAGGIGGVGGVGDTSGYFIDSLFRPGQNAPDAGAAPSAEAAAAGNGNAAMNVQQRAEVSRIFMNAVRHDSLSDSDKIYVAQIVVKRTGMSQADAERRVNATYANYGKAIDDVANDAKVTAEKARKAAAYSALWMFVALLCGAFIASLSATFGGRLRDRDMRLDETPAPDRTYSSTTAPL